MNTSANGSFPLFRLPRNSASFRAKCPVRGLRACKRRSTDGRVSHKPIRTPVLLNWERASCLAFRVLPGQAAKRNSNLYMLNPNNTGLKIHFFTVTTPLRETCSSKRVTSKQFSAPRDGDSFCVSRKSDSGDAFKTTYTRGNGQ